jgi:hypothetical protein
MNIVKTAKDFGINNSDLKPYFIRAPRFYEKMFWKDLKSLNCKTPSVIVCYCNCSVYSKDC